MVEILHDPIYTYYCNSWCFGILGRVGFLSSIVPWWLISPRGAGLSFRNLEEVTIVQILYYVLYIPSMVIQDHLQEDWIQMVLS